MSSIEMSTPAARRRRRLKPEVAAELVEKQKAQRLQHLYQRPVEDLTPEELRLMKINFLRG